MAGSGKRHILVVEDDPSITLGLQMNLEAEGYEVSIAVDGEDGLARAVADSVDLVILDVMLPKMNGFEVVKAIRNQGNHVPVVMLSARGAEMDKVMGLELGAEDYITKPFSLAELLARVKAVLRRDGIARNASEQLVRAGDLEINAATRQVLK
ncbi:MAG TPA: response regulator transcription factor, partial [Polyangiaceae bacterium]